MLHQMIADTQAYAIQQPIVFASLASMIYTLPVWVVGAYLTGVVRGRNLERRLRRYKR